MKMHNQKIPIDLHAVKIPQQSGLAPCLFLPIAARSLETIESYVGPITMILSGRVKAKAVLVESIRQRPETCDLAIWKHNNVNALNQATEVWVHVDYTGYRAAFFRAFPDLDRNLVLDHVLNRRVARLKGFQFLRLAPVDRVVNSSHGGLSEKWAADHHGSEKMKAINKASLASVQYADLSDIVKMMNLEGGGSLMDNVNNAQKLVDAPFSNVPCSCMNAIPHYSKIQVPQL